MEFIVVRDMGIKEYSYKIVENNQITGTANYTAGIALRKIQVTDSLTKSNYLLKQTNVLLKLLNALPLLRLITFPSFKFFINNKYIGMLRNMFLEPLFKMSTKIDEYEVYCHNNNYVSIMQNKKQIALVEREKMVYNETTKYNVKYDNDSDNDLPFIFLLVAFTDVTFFSKSMRYDAMKYEKTIGFKDKDYEKRVNWNPSEVSRNIAKSTVDLQ